ncbi:MAG: ATP-binding cassette domain-containing protein [Halothermotrichaceae bacterium]
MRYNVKLKDLYFKREKSSQYIFKDANLDFKINKGLIMILGPSGSGKSTFLNLLNGLLLPGKGVIKINDIEISKDSQLDLAEYRSSKCSLMFQHYPLVNWLTCKENLKLVTENIDKLNNCLKSLDIEEIGNEFPEKISFGQRQRVSLAQSLLIKTKIKLLDEPTSALGYDHKFKVIEFIKNTSKNMNNLVFLASHDRDLCQYADKIYTIKNKKIYSGQH